MVKYCEFPINNFVQSKEVPILGMVEKAMIIPGGGPNLEDNTFNGKIPVSNSNPKA
jgi:hypothetical protein